MELADISEKIKEFRKEKGISQKALADNIGVHRYTIIRWEMGRHVPLKSMIILLKAVGVL